MKVAHLETFVVGNPPPSFGGRYFVFVKLVTDNGIVGYGEIYAATFGPERIADLARDMFARHFVDADPFSIEALWRKAYGAGFTHRPDTTVMGVFSGLEMALWDIIGKALEKPVYALLGGQVHARLRSYSYIYPESDDVGLADDDPANPYTNADVAAEIAAKMVRDGFTAIKFDPAGPYTVYDGHQPSLTDINRSVQFVKAIRESVGARADLLFGTHGQFTASGAIRLARQIAPHDPLWFEDPVPPDNPAEMARVASAITIPIAVHDVLPIARQPANTQRPRMTTVSETRRPQPRGAR